MRRYCMENDGTILFLATPAIWLTSPRFARLAASNAGLKTLTPFVHDFPNVRVKKQICNAEGRIFSRFPSHYFFSRAGACKKQPGQGSDRRSARAENKLSLAGNVYHGESRSLAAGE